MSGKSVDFRFRAEVEKLRATGELFCPVDLSKRLNLTSLETYRRVRKVEGARLVCKDTCSGPRRTYYVIDGRASA